MKALIAAGGTGSRLRPITFTHNKQLIPIANKPTIQYGLENIRDAGITDILVNVNPGDHSIEEYFGDGSSLGISLQYIEQEGGPLGLAHIIKNAEKFIKDEDFVFYLGDNILVGGIDRFIKKFQEEKFDAMLTFAKVSDPHSFGVPAFNEEGNITHFIEKPKNPPSSFAVAGIFIYNKNIFEAVHSLVPSARGELEITEANTYLLQHGYRVGYEVITGWWKDTGKPRDLLEGNQLVLSTLQGREIHGIIEGDVIIEGAVKIGKGTIIRNGIRTTVIRGPVIIGEDCIIENAHIAPYTSIGNRCKISDSEIAHSILFDGVEVSIGERIVDSIIGKEAKIYSARTTFPIGHRLVIGDHSSIEL